jgi:hypothetical protein
VVDAVKGGDGRHRDGNGNRGLRGGDSSTPGTPEHRSLLSYYEPGGYFDIRVLLEVVGCTLCGGDPDDDDDDYLYRRELSLATDAEHRLLESTLLDRLRTGPFQEFADLDGCSVVYVGA